MREAWIAWTAIQAERVVTSVVELTKADQELKLWPSLFASFCTGQKEVVGRARKPAFIEAGSPRTAMRK